MIKEVMAMKYGNTTSEGCTQEELDEMLEFACTDKLPPFSHLFFIQLDLPLTEHGCQQKSSLFPTVHQIRPPPHPLPIARTS